MSRQIQINLGLTSAVTFDSKTHSYVIYFKEFPNAIAMGKSEDEAEDNLIFLLEDMWQQRQDDIRDYLMKHFPDKIQINKLANC
jgi:predicted RNase H-like HicB family nuclease